MAGFTHQEAKGRMFKVKERKSEKSPHFTGSFMWKGEVVQISGWANLEDGKLASIGIGLSEPQNKDSAPAKQVSKDNDSEWGI